MDYDDLVECIYHTGQIDGPCSIKAFYFVPCKLFGTLENLFRNGKILLLSLVCLLFWVIAGCCKYNGYGAPGKGMAAPQDTITWFG